MTEGRKRDIISGLLWLLAVLGWVLTIHGFAGCAEPVADDEEIRVTGQHLNNGGTGPNPTCEEYRRWCSTECAREQQQCDDSCLRHHHLPGDYCRCEDPRNNCEAERRACEIDCSLVCQTGGGGGERPQ